MDKFTAIEKAEQYERLEDMPPALEEAVREAAFDYYFKRIGTDMIKGQRSKQAKAPDKPIDFNRPGIF